MVLQLACPEAVGGPAPGCTVPVNFTQKFSLGLCSRLSVWIFVNTCHLLLRTVREYRERHIRAWKLPNLNCWACNCLMVGPSVFSEPSFDAWAGLLEAVSMWIRMQILEPCLESDFRLTLASCVTLGNLLNLSVSQFPLVLSATDKSQKINVCIMSCGGQAGAGRLLHVKKGI